MTVTNRPPLAERALRERRLGEVRAVKGEHAFVFERNNRRYKLRFHESGFARLTRAKDEPLSETQVTLGILGAAVGATVLDKSLPAAVLGVLVGAALGNAADAPKRVFTMTLDPSSGEWVAYDGPLANLLRQKRREADAALGSDG